MSKALSIGLCLVVAAGCGAGAEPEELAGLDAAGQGKDDHVGNRFVDRHAGALSFDTRASADIEHAAYKVGYTFRATAGRALTLQAIDADPIGSLDTYMKLYGPRNAAGKYPLVARSDSHAGAPYAHIQRTLPEDGLYLVVVSARAAGRLTTLLDCDDPAGCELACAIAKNLMPVCGVDGRTWANAEAAACYDIAIGWTGSCGGNIGDDCASDLDCDLDNNLYCEKPEGACVGGGVCAERGSGLCTDDWTPVCGCDGATYSNACGALAAGANIAAAGECPKTCTDPSPSTPAESELWGRWEDRSQSPPRTYTFNDDGTFSVEDAVAPCPPGAVCVWSGIVTQSGTWSLGGSTISLTYAGDPSLNGFGLKYDTTLDTLKACSGLALVRQDEDAPTVRDFYRPCADLSIADCSAASDRCAFATWGCDPPPCETDPVTGEVTCHACDPILICADK